MTTDLLSYPSYISQQRAASRANSMVAVLYSQMQTKQQKILEELYRIAGLEPRGGLSIKDQAEYLAAWLWQSGRSDWKSLLSELLSLERSIN